MTPLTAYLARAASEPFRWGTTDCCTFAADWIREASSRDPMKTYRGRYRTAAGAGRLVTRGGGFVPWISSCLAAAELRTTLNPKAGDIGIVRDRDGDMAVAIRTGTLWVARGQHGLVAGPMATVRAWSVPCLR